MKIVKIEKYNPDYPSFEKLKKNKTKGLRSAILAATILSGTIALQSCEPPETAGTTYYSSPESESFEVSNDESQQNESNTSLDNIVVEDNFSAWEGYAPVSDTE